MEAFQPVDASTVVISASTTSAPGAIARQPSGRHQLRIANCASAVAYYRLGEPGVTATTSDVPLPAGGVEVITVNNSDGAPITHVGVILASGAGNVSITTGQGL